MQHGGTLTLADGAQITIREAGRADRDALVAGFERLSPESRLHRFFTSMPKLPSDVIDYLTDIDQDQHVAVGVFDPARPSDVGGADGLGVAVGRYLVSTDEPSRAEAAVAVIDEYQGRGIGTLILETLVVIARERGVTAFTAHVMPDNDGMSAILRGMGAHNVSDANVRELTFEIDVPDAVEPLETTTGYRVMREVARSGGEQSTVVDLGSVATGSGGAVWSLTHGGDLDANLVRLDAGAVVGSHVNDDVDVLMVLKSGSGQVIIDGVANELGPDHLVLVPRGASREVSAGSDGITYLSVHRRRAPMGIRKRPQAG